MLSCTGAGNCSLGLLSEVFSWVFENVQCNVGVSKNESFQGRLFALIDFLLHEDFAKV